MTRVRTSRRRAAWCSLVVAIAFGLAACGGGGGGSGEEGLQGSWRLSFHQDAFLRYVDTGPASAVPAAGELAGLTPAQFVERFGAIAFRGATFTISGQRVVVHTGTGDFELTGVLISNYQGCGSCGLGSTVRFEATVGIKPVNTPLLDESFLSFSYERVD